MSSSRHLPARRQPARCPDRGAGASRSRRRPRSAFLGRLAQGGGRQVSAPFAVYLPAHLRRGVCRTRCGPVSRNSVWRDDAACRCSLGFPSRPPGGHGRATLSAKPKSTGRYAKGSVYVGDRAYAPVIEGARARRVAGPGSGGITLQTVKLFGEGGAPTGISTYVDGDRLLPTRQRRGPPPRCPGRLGRPAAIGADRGRARGDTRIIGGKAHLAHDRLATLLGIRIRWTPGQTVAVLESPRCTSGRYRVGSGFFSEGDVFIPLRLVTDLLGYTLGGAANTRRRTFRACRLRASCGAGRRCSRGCAL